MKTLIKDLYHAARASLDHRIEILVRKEDIIRYGDHFVFTKLLNPESIVIDLGANRGHFSKHISENFHSRIYLLEANGSLLESIDMAGAKKINAAIASSDSEMTFFVSSNPEASSLDKDIASQYGIIEEMRIKSISFCTLLTTENIKNVSLLKVDIEGAELGLFQSMSDEEIRKCSQITVEFHDFMVPELLKETNVIVSKLERLGFRYFKFSPLDWRRVLFIQKEDISTEHPFLFKFRFLAWLSFLLDFTYYRMLIPLNRLLRGKS